MIGVSKAIGFAAEVVGLGVGFGVAFATGCLTAGAFVVVATVRVVETDFAHTVTEVGPVFDE